ALGLRQHLLGLGGLIHAEQVRVQSQRHLVVVDRRADARRDRPAAGHVGAVEEGPGPREVVSHQASRRGGWPSIESSAMSRRKKSEVVQSVTTRSFREKNGSW